MKVNWDVIWPEIDQQRAFGVEYFISRWRWWGKGVNRQLFEKPNWCAILKCLDPNWRAWETFWEERLHEFPVLARLSINLRLSLFSGTGDMALGKKKPATPGPRTAVFFSSFFAVVWIKWTNIFRPAYFTPRHLRGKEGARCRCLGKEPSGKKALDEAGERQRRREKGRDRGDPAVSKSPWIP